MTVILSSVCQCFFTWYRLIVWPPVSPSPPLYRRVRLLTGRKWLFYILLLFVLIQFLMGTATTIATTIVKVQPYSLIWESNSLR